MKTIFSPAIVFLNKMKFFWKFALISNILGIAIAILAYSLFKQLESQIVFNEKETIGIQYIQSVQALYENALAYSSNMIYVSQGDEEAIKRTNEIKKSIDQAFDDIERIDNTLKGALNKEGNSFSDDIGDLKSTWTEIKKDAGMKSQDQLLYQIVDLYKNEIANNSNLILDPDIDTYYLMDSVLFKIPALTKEINHLQYYIEKYKGGKELSLEQKIEMISIIKGIESNIVSISSNFETQIKNTQKKNWFSDIKVQVEEINRTTQKLIDSVNNDFLISQRSPFQVTEQIALATTTITGAHKFHAANTNVLKKLIDIRINSYEKVKNLSTIAIIIFSVLAVYLFIGFYLSVQQAVQKIQLVAEQIESGDLTAKATVDSKDEFAMVNYSFNNIIDSFRNIIYANQKMIEELSTNSDKLLSNSRRTSEITNQVTSQLREINVGMKHQVVGANESSKSIEDMSINIQNIAEFANQVSQVSIESTKKSEDGNKLLHEMTAQINSIQTSFEAASNTIYFLEERSKDIGKIIDYINSISNQTNLLALNASIESVRAGEHGKGFAVVAQEVRKLAEMSSQSSKQISGLIKEIQSEAIKAVQVINEGSKEVISGIKIVNEASQSFQEILVSTQKVSLQTNEISDEIQHISAASEEITSTVEEMSAIAISSADNTNNLLYFSNKQLDEMAEISLSVESLNRISKELEDNVKKFVI